MNEKKGGESVGDVPPKSSPPCWLRVFIYEYYMHDIYKTLQIWCKEGQVYEIRVPKTKKRGVISGYFDDFKSLGLKAEELSGDTDIPAVYPPWKPS